MGFLNRILHRKPSHDEWLAAHPGKAPSHAEAASISTEEAARMRSQMEGELDAERAKRTNE